MASSQARYVRVPSEDSFSRLEDDLTSAMAATSTTRADTQSTGSHTEYRDDLETSGTLSSKNGDEAQILARVELTEEDVRVIHPVCGDVGMLNMK
jgi:tRNA A37 threonylcarbamoyladenosine synthetase subunit TsaC/SUA5/YrdC